MGLNGTSKALIDLCKKPNAGLFWPFIVIVILAYLIWTEDGSQNCLNKKCNNDPPVMTEEDSPLQGIDKLVQGIRLNHTIVGWRRAMIVAIVISILIFLIFKSRFPHGFVFFIIAMIIFLCVYFMIAFNQFSWWKTNDERIEEALISLRHRINSDHHIINRKGPLSIDELLSRLNDDDGYCYKD